LRRFIADSKDSVWTSIGPRASSAPSAVTSGVAPFPVVGTPFEDPFWAAMSAGTRTATAHVETPRIITPSSTA
jgi:hypothetical protein